ncbi:MAG TPA: ferritin-like domain-containing protein [Pirellulales bacterium]|nr:ferritin-like domain-containing protein [Pirellulales bacterium]
MAMRTLEDLFLDELKDIYDSEKRITKALPKMAKSAASDDLREAFQSHLRETEQQVKRLEQIFELLEKPARGKKCEAMEGLIEEGKELMEEDAEEAVLDAGLICAAQKVEHYEIAAYGSLVTWSKILGYNRATKLLEQTLAEEKAADEKLTEVAGEINFEAEHEEMESA